MQYKEIHKDLFTLDNSYHLAHCISSDAKMGAGIAVQFKKRFPHPKEVNADVSTLMIGSAVHMGRVFHLITKKNFYGKPTYASVKDSLIDMREQALEKYIPRIAMPKIGSGLDRLSWDKVSELIQEVFQDTDIEILICKY